MLKSNAALFVFLTGSFMIAAATSASAIECREDYQIVNGQPISTPYCRDGYLAQVAREYGFKASASAIRNNPSRKEEVCRFIGNDIRVQTACSEVLPTPRDSR
ncbi:hypothetical protein RLW55_03370 [Hyphomicrobium sp. B1]|uniref:hypothetical protein n=1 Tax=Hyphomicrobium sp. B1 TaxID=3075651 RepID=UPI003C2AFAAD